MLTAEIESAMDFEIEIPLYELLTQPLFTSGRARSVILPKAQAFCRGLRASFE